MSSKHRSFDSLNVRMRCGASWWASRIRCTERRLTPVAFASIRPVQWCRKWLFAGLARLVAREPCNALLHEPRLPSPHHGLRLARSAHDLGGAAAIGRREDDVGPPHVLLRRAAIRDDRLKPSAIHSGNVHDSSCSHDESLNCFGQLGNCPNESDQ